MELAIVGGTTVDLIFQRLKKLPAWPGHGEFTPDNLVLPEQAPICTLGGNGANAAYVASRCGASVQLHTQLGDDAMGSLARGWLEGAGCRISAPAGSATSVNVTAANARQQRATFFYPGSAITMPSFASRKNPSHLLVAGWPHPPLPDLASGLTAARRRGVFTSLDVGPILGRAWSLNSLRDTLNSLDLFIANEYEFQRITRTDDLAEAVVKLRRSFSGHAVIKRGDKGALWLSRETNDVSEFPSHRIKAVNTVGAGDSFNGGLLAALVEGRTFHESMRYASKVAASVVASTKGVLGMVADHA